MKKETIQQLEIFTDSDVNSKTEEEFTSQQFQGYFDQKLKKKYAERLNKEFGIQKESDGRRLTEKTSRFSSRILLIVAALVILAGVAYVFLEGSKEPVKEMIMANKRQLYTPIDANIRGNQPNHQVLLSKMANAYESKDFSQVIANYEKIKSLGLSYDMTLEQMAGVAYASSGNIHKAIAIFDSILDQPESTYSNHSTVRYLLGIVHLMNDDRIHARQMFEQIKPGDYKYGEAQQMLENM